MAVERCREFLSSRPGDMIRLGDVYGFMIEHYPKQTQFKPALALIEDMRNKIANVNVAYYVNLPVIFLTTGGGETDLHCTQHCADDPSHRAWTWGADSGRGREFRARGGGGRHSRRNGPLQLRTKLSPTITPVEYDIYLSFIDLQCAELCCR